MARGWMWGIPVAGVALVGSCLGAYAALKSWWYLPADVEAAPVACRDDAPLLPRATPLKVLVWNVQFGASRKQEFFYDGGTAVSVPEHQVLDTIDAIVEVIRAEDPDLVVLQEVDRGSRRTAFTDQHAMIRDKLGFPCHTAAPYHKVPYVPTPSHEHMGRVDMNLSVFSRYQISDATRFQLPLLKESAARRIFNLRRALLDVRMPIEGGGELRVFDTHLSAFSMNDGTLEEQVQVLVDHAQRAQDDGVPWLLAGDFNSLPPGDDPARIDAADFYKPESAVQPLFDAFDTPFPAADAPELRTYVPWGVDEPDRTIDYLFQGGVQTSDLRVLREHPELSDHLPFVMTFEVP